MAGRAGGNITERFYGDRFGGATGSEAENKNNGEDEYSTRRTNRSMQYFSSLTGDALRLPVFHWGNTGRAILTPCEPFG